MSAVADEIHGRSKSAAARRLKEIEDEERQKSKGAAYGFEGKTVGEIIDEKKKRDAEIRRLKGASRPSIGGND